MSTFKLHKLRRERIEEMRVEIFDNLYGASIDDGEDEELAELKARATVDILTDKEVLELYEEMTS